MKRRKVNLSLKGGGGGGAGMHPPKKIKKKKSIKSKHLKCSTERCLLGQKHNLQIFGVIPFVKLQIRLLNNS